MLVLKHNLLAVAHVGPVRLHETLMIRSWLKASKLAGRRNGSTSGEIAATTPKASVGC
jgi:hypothetical protein